MPIETAIRRVTGYTAEELEAEATSTDEQALLRDSMLAEARANGEAACFETAGSRHSGRESKPDLHGGPADPIPGAGQEC